MNFALFENTFDSNGISNLFIDYVDEIYTYDSTKLDSTFEKINHLSKSGYYLIGYISYELNNTTNDTTKPLIHFMAYKQLVQFPHYELEQYLHKYNIKHNFLKDISIDLIEAENDFAEYQEMFNNVIEHLTLGDSYQINLTQRYKIDTSQINEFSLYYYLSRNNKVAYASYLPFNSNTIVSISPELFFSKINTQMRVNPMKGTMARSLIKSIDQKNKQYLQNDSKNKSENLIIVDLLRNDLAKIANTGSVKAKKLFNVEEYPTVFQMTSEITADIDDNISLQTIIKNIFPSGSITGAPKKRTMELIKQIEKSDRDIYTGSIGYILPNNDMQFNVAIRTLDKSTKNKFAVIGAGGGITINSKVNDEWEEMNTKLRFISQHYNPSFKLVESMHLEKHQINNLAEHLDRLKSSANKLLFKYDINTINSQINNFIKNDYLKTEKSKLRLELDNSGNLLIEADIIHQNKSIFNIMLLNKQIDTSHPLFKHKTTSPLVRGLYSELDNKYKPINIDEILFINQNDEVTEARFYNLIIEINGKLVTPPVECGLLNGIHRQIMIKNKILTEQIIYKEMLNQATKIFLCNDVRGLIECSYHGEINDTHH
ncbi:MAG: bifunctional anthranilate synthase component I family protein/class IV aminotransferase [Burkholderiales bacterium]|nr:bifunctional anthranilate synthase component I family protein/class IV aminotransferase [Burkholderiales bacterium]